MLDIKLKNFLKHYADIRSIFKNNCAHTKRLVIFKYLPFPPIFRYTHIIFKFQYFKITNYEEDI